MADPKNKGGSIASVWMTGLLIAPSKAVVLVSCEITSQRPYLILNVNQRLLSAGQPRLELVVHIFCFSGEFKQVYLDINACVQRTSIELISNEVWENEDNHIRFERDTDALVVTSIRPTTSSASAGDLTIWIIGPGFKKLIGTSSVWVGKPTNCVTRPVVPCLKCL